MSPQGRRLASLPCVVGPSRQGAAPAVHNCLWATKPASVRPTLEDGQSRKMRWNVTRQQWIPTPRAKPTELPLDALSPSRRAAHARITQSMGKSKHSEVTQASPVVQSKEMEGAAGWLKPRRQLQLTRNLWLKSRPMMEVAEPASSGNSESSYTLSVHSEVDSSSKVVAQLVPFTRFHVLTTCDLADGSRRGCILRHGDSRPLGWLTTMTSRGEHLIHMCAHAVGNARTRTLLTQPSHAILTRAHGRSRGRSQCSGMRDHSTR